MTDPLDPSDVHAIALRREEGRRAKEHALVVKAIMETKQGRDWLYRLLDSCHIYGNAFEPGAADVTAFNLGQMNVGRHLLAEIQSTSPNLYLKMIREAKEEEKRLEMLKEESQKPVEDDDLVFKIPELPEPQGWTKPKQ